MCSRSKNRKRNSKLMLRLISFGHLARVDSLICFSFPAIKRTGCRIGRFVASVGCVALGVSLTSCSKPLTRSDCEKLLLRYVEHLSASDRPDSTALDRLKFQQEARVKAARDPEFSQCARTVSRKQFECAMASTNTDDFERCLM
jgi:hypothetical protein